MSIRATKKLRNLQCQTDSDVMSCSVRPLTVLTLIKTMLEIIKIKKGHIMDKKTREQFPMIAKEIILLAEQTQ